MDLPYSFSGENSSYSQHPRWADFKNEGRVAEKQRSRRQVQLDRQKRAREIYLNRFRALYDQNDSGDTPSANEVQMTDASASSETSASMLKNKFADILMLSEWLVDIPGELSNEWTMLPCPVGKRCLVVASRGSTKVYAKNGRLLSTFQSALPGGHSRGSRSSTMLDCIQAGWKKKKFYVLDLLNWGDQQQYTEMSFTLRRFFLNSKLEEMAIEKSKLAFPFSSLSSCTCDKGAMEEFMKGGFEFELDGLLFHYNEALYTPGQTPLVGWLKPWMVKEILSVEVPDHYFPPQAGRDGKAPVAAEFIQEFNEKKNYKSSITQDEMQDA